MKVNFIFPAYYDVPIGGYKIVYSYANGLIKRGHDVSIIYVDNYEGRKAPKSIRRFVRILKHKLMIHTKRLSWFPLDIKVHLALLTKEKNTSEIPKADVVIATAASTAFLVNDLPLSKGEKFYFVQGDERTFGGSDVKTTWELPLKKIVVASWLKKLLYSEVGQAADLVPNFVDDKVFDITTPVPQRDTVISMLIHKDEIKGTRYGLQALLEVQHEFPDIKIKLFGMVSFDGFQDLRYEYVKNADSVTLRKIYNSSSIFVVPSIVEGWGLTATEAMRCGAALVSAQNGGVDDFAINGHSAVLVKSKSSDELVSAIMGLLKNTAYRIRIANNGYKQVSQFTFDRSMDLFEKALFSSED